MHSADPSGREDLYSRTMRKECRRRDRGRTIQPSRCRDREVASRDLSDVVAGRKLLDLVTAQPDATLAAKNRYRRGDRSNAENDPFEFQRGLEVVRVRQAMSDDRRLERDKGKVVDRDASLTSEESFRILPRGLGASSLAILRSNSTSQNARSG